MTDSRRKWTPERDAILREMYPAATREAMEAALGASWSAIATYAARNGMRRDERESRLLSHRCESCGAVFERYLATRAKNPIPRYCSRACRASVSEVRVEGEVAYVTLTRGYIATIDAADAPLVGGHKWSVRGVNTGIPYACSWRAGHMHRLIAGCPDGMQVDHIDRNSLNNRRDNLRIVTPEQNGFNRSKKQIEKGSSKYKGVSKKPGRDIWCVSVKGKYYCSKRNEKEAALEYDRIALELYGEYAATNRSIYPEDF